MEKSTAYLSRFKDIIHALAVKFELKDEEVVEIIDHFFQTLKRFITDFRMPTIKISKWGTFRPSIGLINWQIDKTLWHMSKEHGDREKMFKRIRHIQGIKERLLAEKRGEWTWKEWRDKKEEDGSKTEDKGQEV